MPHAAATSAGARYLAVLLAGVVAGIAAAWFWSARMQMTFQNPEYAAMAAKQQLLQGCDVGTTLIMGDSRAGAGLVPRQFAEPATNVAVGGAKPVEVYFAARHALACPRPPERVVISFVAGHFNNTDLFWERSARFGLFSFAELEQVRRDSKTVGDDSLLRIQRTDGLPDVVRSWIYAHSFPSLNFASMLRGGVFLRYKSNKAVLQETLEARGHRLFGQAEGVHELAEEASMTRFDFLPISVYYFEKTLEALEAHGIPTFFVVMPVNDSTYKKMSPELWEEYMAFLHGYEERFPHFRVVTKTMPHLADDYFGDHLSHLNMRGAELFSRDIDQDLSRLKVASEIRPK